MNIEKEEQARREGGRASDAADAIIKVFPLLFWWSAEVWFQSVKHPVQWLELIPAHAHQPAPAAALYPNDSTKLIWKRDIYAYV